MITLKYEVPRVIKFTGKLSGGCQGLGGGEMRRCANKQTKELEYLSVYMPVYTCTK